MKRALNLAVVLTVVALAVFSAGQSNQNQSSLGDYARAVRKHKPAPSGKTFDNDNLPSKGTVSVVGTSPEDKPAGDQAATDANAAAGADQQKKDSPELKTGQSTEDREKALDAWKSKIADQKGKIDLLSRELDVLQRERQIKQANFYASTARAVQNARGFDEDDSKFQKQIGEKQKQLDDAKAKLSDLQEQARKAGAPNSITQ